MIEDFKLKELSLNFAPDRQQLVDFIARHSLQYEENIETALGVFDCGNQLVGCGCCTGNLLKCFAVNEDLRGQNILGVLVSNLVNNRFLAGYCDLFLVTRPHNQLLFSACGFYPLAQTDSVVLLENCRNGLEKYYQPLAISNSEQIGCAVVNCDPFTLGHLALISYAAAHCNLLYVFVVQEERSCFPFADRIALVRRGTEHLANVRVYPSGPYIISHATFPTYFLKKDEDAVQIQAELDATLFAKRIAPILHITKRFAGQEPLDVVTAHYNAAMMEILPRYGIDFCEIPRICRPDGAVISASAVRALIAQKGADPELEQMVPSVTVTYIKNSLGKGKK